MLKLLVRKQFQELFSRMLRRSAVGKKQAHTNVVLYGVLLLYLFGCMGFLFYTTASTLCAPLVNAGLGWLYFALMGVTATGLGVVGSIFTAYATLYQSRDNELLLSMPIPPRLILLSRALTVFLMALLFEAIVWIPACVAYFVAFPPTAATVAAALLLLVLLPLLSTALTCVLGWLIALVSARIPHSQVVTLVLSLAFLAAYFYVVSQLSHYLQAILLNRDGLAGKVKAFLYPFYHMGLGAAGSLPSLLLFAAMALVATGVVYAVLSANFLRLTTTRKARGGKGRRAAAGRAVSPDAALLRKEFLRFTGSATYMLNSGIGVIFLLALPIAALLKGEDLLATLPDLPELTGLLPLMACGITALLTAMCPITAPSVSLEGKTLWQVQSLPVTPWQVLRAKLALHLLVVGIPTLFCGVGLALFVGSSLLTTLLIALFCLLFAALCAVFGLFINLKLPNLNWTNETVAVKQSLSVLIALFAPWGALALLGVGAFLLYGRLALPLILLLGSLLTALAAALLLWWLEVRGSKLLAAL